MVFQNGRPSELKSSRIVYAVKQALWSGHVVRGVFYYTNYNRHLQKLIQHRVPEVCRHDRLHGCSQLALPDGFRRRLMFIVFVPFIMMTIITSLLLFVMGLSPSKGRNRVKVDHTDRDHEEARHRQAEERIHNHEARLREQTHYWREERRHEEERHQQEKRYLEHRRNQHRRSPSRSRRLDPYDYHDGHHHNNDVLYEEFDGYNTDGSDMLEYHEIRTVHAKSVAMH